MSARRLVEHYDSAHPEDEFWVFETRHTALLPNFRAENQQQAKVHISLYGPCH